MIVEVCDTPVVAAVAAVAEVVSWGRGGTPGVGACVPIAEVDRRGKEGVRGELDLVQAMLGWLLPVRSSAGISGEVAELTRFAWQESGEPQLHACFVPAVVAVVLRRHSRRGSANGKIPCKLNGGAVSVQDSVTKR